MATATTVPRTAALVLELHEFGVAMMRQNLVRRRPHDSEQEIERRLVTWLHTRPGAEFGDGDGVPSDRFTRG